MKTILIKNANIVNEGKIFHGNVLIENDRIAKISSTEITTKAELVIDASGKYLFPGCIDDQVHFREPGLIHKAEIYTEAKAAVAGGVTSFMEMPNTVPNTFTQELLEEKYKRASEVSLANYSFFMGASNDNIEEVLKTNPRNVCGIKVFMGSSTGNMLVDKNETLEALFSKCKLLIATHCEDETTIKNNIAIYKEKYGEDIPMECHPLIRSEEACYKSSALAVALAKKHNTRLHILHISTAKELELFDSKIPLKQKRITAEACIHHLWFSDEDYKTKDVFIKWNPAVKKVSDRDALLKGVLENKIDIIATDHAPHTLEEKQQSYFKAPSGGPLVQHSLVAMLELHKQGKISLEKIAEKMAHAVADCFQIEKRGYIREGYFADLVLVDLNDPWTVDKSNIYYKCGWSPFEGITFHSKITHTFVNGNLVYDKGHFNHSEKGQRLLFER
ncbi:MAG: dihydroorotase [Bacteroidetes bacterium RIFCSPLOWO2_12_FULL_35_15]|nr:MAG: dihydroorotase [Bacteroidetes bacterium RIFCSPLOWO2_12_FULL_35_15]